MTKGTVIPYSDTESANGRIIHAPISDAESSSAGQNYSLLPKLGEDVRRTDEGSLIFTLTEILKFQA